MKFKFPYQILALLLLVSNLSFGQNKQIKVFTLEDGLPQSKIHAMVQDNKGYLWLGTQGGGLARFDGEVFEVYNNNNGLSSNYINALTAINDTLYIGTNKGLSIKIKQSFKNIGLNEVNKIIALNHERYILTKSGIYKMFDGLVVNKLEIYSEINSADIRDLLFYKNSYWIATNNGLWRLNEMNSNAETIQKIEQGQFVALAGYQNKIYASTFDDGTLVINPQRINEPLLLREPLGVNSSVLINNNQLWLTCESDGVSVIDLETNTEIFQLNSSNGLPISNVKQALQDEQSNVWLATSGGGLIKYFQNNFKHYNTQTGLKGNQIYAVYHSNNTIWISTSNKGLMRLDELGIHDVQLPDAFSEVKIKTIRSDAKGHLWMGSEGKGVMFKGTISLDNEGGKRPFKEKKSLLKSIDVSKVWNTDNGFPFDRIRDILTINDTIYASSYSKGIVKFSYDASQDKLEIFKIFSDVNGIVDLDINHMIKNENRIWYATKKGHLGFISNDQITHLGNVLQSDLPIQSILFWKNTLFLGTAGDGIWWSNDEEFNTFKKLQGTKALSSENIYQLIIDDQGFLWAGTERGVDKLQINNDNEILDAFYFGSNDGFLGVETCLNAVDKDNSGHLWFGALYGLSEYEPYESNQSSKKPTIYFEDLKVAYNSIDSINLKTWTNSGRIWKLSPQQKQVSFTFKTVDLNHPDGVSYRYKLNKNEWSLWSPNNTQEFSELNYGAHNFIVQSRNYRWVESEPIGFSFYIESPLHKKPWFIALVIGLITLIVIISVIQYIRRLKQKNTRDKKQLKLENHLLNLEQKALRLQMNPHFIFNVLNGIKAMAPTKPDKMNDTVNSFASLLRETLVNSREDTISLDQEIKTLKHYIEVEQLMAVDGFDYEINVNSDINSEEILVPPMLIQPFVENAIRHGIIKGPRKGKLIIQFETINDILKVSIEDNGIGIYQSQEQKLKTDHQSMALKVTKERLESITGKDALIINEIKLNDGSVGGTIIMFELPLETDF